jgi:hypothetical protein
LKKKRPFITFLLHYHLSFNRNRRNFSDPYSLKGGGRQDMQSFIVEHYLQKNVDVYCGGPDTFQGIVEACADGVLTIRKEDKYTHIAIDKIIAIWEK